MRTGKVSTAVLDRSVLRPIRLSGNEKNGKAGLCSTVCGSWSGLFDPTPEMYFRGVCNKVFAEGGKPEQMTMDLLLPETFPETELKNIVRQIAKWASESEIRICGGHTEVSDAVLRPVLTLTVWSNPAVPEKKAAKAGEMPLVMAGCAGWSGSGVLANAGREGLLKRYPPVILDGCLQGFEDLRGDRIMETAAAFEVSSVYAVAQGGVFGALWEMGDRDGVGFETDIKKIPIRQETIEICEWYDVNPYQLYGTGAFLMTCQRAEELVEALHQQRIYAQIIGSVNEGRDRIIRNGEEVRYLDKPGQDMLMAAARKEKERL